MASTYGSRNVPDSILGVKEFIDSNEVSFYLFTQIYLFCGIICKLLIYISFIFYQNAYKEKVAEIDELK